MKPNQVKLDGGYDCVDYYASINMWQKASYRSDRVLRSVTQKRRNHESIYSQAITGPYLFKLAGD